MLQFNSQYRNQLYTLIMNYFINSKTFRKNHQRIFSDF